MHIIPPELEPFDRRKYFDDIEYRELVDNETYGERHERLHLLFHQP